MNRSTSTLRPLKHLVYGWLVFSLLLFTFSCTSRSKKEKELLNKWKTEARNLLKQQHLLFWFHGVQGMRMRLAESFKNHQELLAPPTIQFVVDAMSEAQTPAKAQELRFLRNFLLQKHLEMRLATLDDSLRLLYQTASVRAGKRTIAFHDLPFALANAKRQTERQMLYRRALSIRQQFAQLIAQKYQNIRHIVRQLGYPDYNEFIAEIYEIHPHDLYRLSTLILDSTADEYRALTEALQKLYALPNTPRLPDMPLLRSGQYFDTYIQPPQLQAMQHLLLRSLGIDPRKQTGLTQDFNQGPEKIYYRLMLAVDIPVDIRLSLKPTGHVEDYWQLFYLTGQAEHYLNTEISSWINQQLGSPAMRKVYGYLFANVWRNPAWLRHAMPITGEDSLRYYQYARWYQLHYLRRYAQTVQWGYEACADSANASARWRAATSRMLENTFPEFGIDVIHAEFDPYLTAALELEAIIVASQLEDFMKGAYGSNWFENPESGKFLKSLWWRGNEITIQYILKKINMPHLTAEYVISTTH